MRTFNWLLLGVRVRSARHSPKIPPLSRVSRTAVLLYNLLQFRHPLGENLACPIFTPSFDLASMYSDGPLQS